MMWVRAQVLPAKLRTQVVRPVIRRRGGTSPQDTVLERHLELARLPAVARAPLACAPKPHPSTVAKRFPFATARQLSYKFAKVV